MKYFGKGHTFVSADSFYRQIEKEIKMRKVYNFPYFESVISSKGLSGIPNEGDFFQNKSE